MSRNDISYTRQKNWPSITLFVLFLIATLSIWLLQLNQKLFITINGMHDMLPNAVWAFFCYIALPKFFILPAILLVVTYIFRRNLLLNVILLIIAYYLLFYGLKVFVGEARPYMVLSENSIYWVDLGENPIKLAYKSFPSGHTGLMAVFVFSLIAMFFRNHKAMQVLLFACLVLEGLARICTGWHWPIDVLASGLIGYVLVRIAFRFTHRL